MYKGENAHLDGPSPKVCDAREAVEARRRVFRDEGVLLSEGSGHVAGTVTRLHLKNGQMSQIHAQRSGRSGERTIMRTFSTGPMEPIKVRTPSCSRQKNAALGQRWPFPSMSASSSAAGHPLAGPSARALTHLVVELLELDLVLGDAWCDALASDRALGALARRARAPCAASADAAAAALTVAARAEQVHTCWPFPARV